MEHAPAKHAQIALLILRIALVPCLVFSLLAVLSNADEFYGIWAGKGTLRYSNHLFYDISQSGYLSFCGLIALVGLFLAVLQVRALTQGKSRQIVLAILLFGLFLLLLFCLEMYLQSIYTGYEKG